MSLFHLALQSEWRAGWKDGRYTPARFSADGFIHCVDGEAGALAIANAYFSKATEPVVLAEVDEGALDVKLVREAPAPPDGKPHAHHDGRLFPHVYGSLPARAVVRIGELTRDPNGGFGFPREWAFAKPPAP